MLISGYKVLLVEDEALLSEVVTAALIDAEAEVVGPAATVGEAQKLAKSERLDAAVLDLNLLDGQITSVLESLLAREIPTVIYTGGELPTSVMKRHPHLLVCKKPVSPAKLIAHIKQATGQRRAALL
jgi:DNA-binding response OmpR family regulator